MHAVIKKGCLSIVSIGFIASAFVLTEPAPAQAEDGFFSSLRSLFGKPRTNLSRTRPKKVRPKRVVPRQPILPKLTFAYAHQAGRHKRFRYSHQTPYGYYSHPFKHGLAAPTVSRLRPVRKQRPGYVQNPSRLQPSPWSRNSQRLKRRPRKRAGTRKNFSGRRQEFRFSPQGRVKRTF